MQWLLRTIWDICVGVFGNAAWEDIKKRGVPVMLGTLLYAIWDIIVSPLGPKIFVDCLGAFTIGLLIDDKIQTRRLRKKWEQGELLLPINAEQQHRISSWLEMVATEDSRDMTHRVHLESGSEITAPHLNASEPYVDLPILLLNSSVYTLTLAKVEGKMTFGGSPLQSTVEILNTRRELKHAEYYHLELRQWLQPNTAQLILTSDRAEFTPGSVALWFTYQDQVDILQSVRIAFGNTPFIVKR